MGVDYRANFGIGVKVVQKEIVKGTIYEDLNGYKILYLGKGKLRVEQNPGYGKNEIVSEKEGEVFKSIFSERFTNSCLTSVDVLKGIKKLVKPVGIVNFLDSYSYTAAKGAYRYYNTTILLLYVHKH